MKIARIAKTVVPSTSAHSTHIVKMCEAFQANGNDVLLITSPEPKNISEFGDFLKYYGIEYEFNIKRISKPHVANGWRFWSWRAVQLAKAEGIELVYTCMLEVAVIAALSGVSVVYEEHKSPEYWSPPGLGERFKSWRKHTGSWLNSLLIARNDFPGIKDFHAIDDVSGFASQHQMFRIILQNANVKKIVCITHTIANEIYPQIPPSGSKNKVLVVPNGAKITAPPSTKHTSGNSEKLVIGYCGSLSPNKGMAVIERLAHALPEMIFHILGGSTEEISFWENRFSKLKNVQFFGYVAPGNIDQYINTFDLCLLPNGDSGVDKGRDAIGQYHYTSPMKLFKFMAAGKAIVASDLPVIREVLEHNKNALLCPYENLSSWQEAIYRLKRDRELRNTLGQQAFQDLSNHYTWNHRAQRIVESLQ